MTWIRVETNVGDNPKIHAFASDISISIDAAIGFLVRTWGSIAEHRPSGDLKDVSDLAIEHWAYWRGEPGVFGKAFRERFMVGDIVHGWLGRQGKLLERSERDRQRNRPKLAHPRYIYVMRREDGLVKIGCSRNPDHRLVEVERLIGMKLTLVGTVPGGYEMERRAHELLSAYRVVGEWFAPVKPVTDWCTAAGIPLSVPLSKPLPDHPTVRNETKTVRDDEVLSNVVDR